MLVFGIEGETVGEGGGGTEAVDQEQQHSVNHLDGALLVECLYLAALCPKYQKTAIKNNFNSNDSG